MVWYHPNVNGGGVQCDLYIEQCLPSDLLVLTTVTALYAENIRETLSGDYILSSKCWSYTSNTGHKSIKDRNGEKIVFEMKYFALSVLGFFVLQVLW
jgi:hypothetical protein